MPSILVIEDDQEFRQMVRHILELPGFVVQEASNGDEGLKVFRQEIVDMVITDIMMPGKDGIATIKELKELSPELPIVAISGELGGAVHRLSEAKDLGVFSALRKPFTKEDVVKAVKDALTIAVN